MRSSRLLALVMRLQDRGPATAAELADELEVSVRTVYRDVAALQAAGVPLWTEPGHGGGVRLVEGWRTRLDGLTGDEAAALFLAGAPGVAADLGLGTLLAAAESKVLSTLPPELRSRAGRMRERFLLDAPGWFFADEPLEHLAAVADAVWSGRVIEMGYRSGSGPAPAAPTRIRRVHPLGLVVKGGLWYLVAANPRGVGTWRVSRIASAVVTDDPVERPPGFDLATWWQSSTEEFDRSLLRATCRVRLSPRAQRALPTVVNRDAARRAIDAAVPIRARAEDGTADVDGWAEVDLEVESIEVAAGQLLALGDGVEVVAPLELRRRFAATARAMANRNG